VSIDLWQAVAMMVIAGVLGAWGSRWLYGRDAKALAREMAKLEAEVQSSAKMLARSRKQADELQRLVAEYRRRINAAEVARHRDRRTTVEEPAAPPVMSTPEPEPLQEETGKQTGTGAAKSREWADTQPFET
jgi:hypothetical protein